MAEHMQGLPGNKMAGRDLQGRTVYFTPDQVHTQPLRYYANGKRYGILYPSEPNEPIRWGERFNPYIRTYLKNYREEGSNRYGEEKRLPWTTDRSFHVIGHANKDGFQIAVNTAPAGQAPTYEKVMITGGMHGRLVASNRHFQEAMAENSRQALVYLACSAGATFAFAAPNSSGYLRHGTDFEGRAFAGTGTVALP